MNEMFTLKYQSQYNLRNLTYFDVPKVRTVNHGSERDRYLGLRFGKLYQHIYKS